MIHWQNIIPALIIALVCYLVCRAVIGTYFKAKEGFVNKLVDKLKGANNGREK